ncbi:MAG: hypothetical protein HQK89_08880, partial [Nitrospirae bacterium]|nr:hypothetical protein [Nitrospirota bacterium]
TLNAFTGESLSMVYADKATANTPIYMKYINKNTNTPPGRGFQPFVLFYGNDALYEFQASEKDKKTEAGTTVDGRTKLTPLRPSMPQLKEIYLVRLSRGSKGYSLVGLTVENGLYVDSTISIDLPLAYPNVPTYFNQGVYPPQEMLSLLREMESTIDWRNEGGIRRLTSLAAQLYPADNDFREALFKYRVSVLKEKRLLAGIETLKAEMRKKAKKYDYLTIIQWVMSENVEKKLDYIVKNDPEFLEEDGIAGLYTKIRVAREFVEAFFPLANWIVILSFFVLIVFNYPFFIKTYYEIFLRGRIKHSWKEILASEPTARQLVDEIGVDELIKRRNSHLSDLKLRFLLPLVIKRGDNLWHDCLRLIEDVAIQKGHQRDRAFFRYLLYLYKKLFYIKIRRESLTRWLVFQLMHFFRRDFYDFPSSDPALNTIQYELALKFLSLNEYKPAFNYINKQILACPDNPQLREFLNLIQEHKIENYFYTLGSHFFKRNRGLESQIKILSYFKGLNLSHRVDLILNDMLRESLRRNGFPKVVVSDYVPLQCVQVHPMYLSISAYNYIRKAKVVLRCIPFRYRSLNLTSDPRTNTLPEQFARLYNTHRNRRWIVQVEADLSEPVLEGGKLPPKDVQKVLLSIIGLVKKVSPLWFVPNLHPSFVHYDGTTVCLSGTGLSKLELDRLTIRMPGVFKKKANVNLFTTPEFYDNPHTEVVLSDRERMNKTVSYLIGLLAYWMIEGHMPENEEPRQFGQFGPPGRLGKFREAERFVYAAMAPYEVRATLETLEHIALSMPVEWKT